MDLFFIPGDTPADRLAQRFFVKRPGATRPTIKPVKNHLEGFLGTLVGDTTLTRPIGDIITVAHGADVGQYFIPLKGSVGVPADFEKVVTADTNDTIRIDAALVTPSGGGAQATITVRMMGCNIGEARPLIEKFQSAMKPKSGALHVIAPLHFDEVHSIKGGLVEFLAHNFTLRVKDKFPDLASLLNAFDQKGFTYLDGTAIPATAWDAWVPRDIHPSDSPQEFGFDVTLDPAANGQTDVRMHRQYRFKMEPFMHGVIAPDPGTDHDRIELLRRNLPKASTPAGEHVYDPSYPWPLWKRYGFAKLDDFVDNLNWKDTFDRSTNKHLFTAKMPQYTVMLPVTDPPGPTVPPKPPPRPRMTFYNFYPDGNTTADMHIDETNAKLFLIL